MTLATAAVFGCFLAGSAPTPAAAATTTWLDRLNSWRASSGLPALTENTTWSSGDYAHSLYMVKNDLVTHYETPGVPYYTVDGDTAARNGNIQVSSTTATTDDTAIDWWMAAPFHAMGMMDPRLTQTGFGAYREIKTNWQAGFSLDVLRGISSAGAYPVYFPGNGSTVPLTTFKGGETPDPLTACPGYVVPTGLPAFIQVGANTPTSVTAHTMTANGAAIAHCVIDSTNPTFTNNLKSRGGVIVIPQQPLVPGVKYVVTLTVNGVPYSWSFGVTATGSFVPAAPTNVNAVAGNATATVGWTAPSNTGGTPITSYTVTSYIGSTAQATQAVPAGTTSATFNGLTNGVAYWFSVAATNAAGNGPAANSSQVMPSASGATLLTSYFNWFDNATPGMSSDNFHVLNTSGTVAHVSVTVPGASPLNFTVASGTEQHVTFPQGTIGGPVVFTSDQSILASQRVQYYSSFNEVWAMTAAQASTTSYVNWFDRASPGMVGDNIHVLNPGTTAASVVVSMSGASPISFNLDPGKESYVSFPQGTIGGPVKISSTQPVLAAQRVQYYQTFNEVVARNAGDAKTESFFNWFDTATPGMYIDNVHILNPGTTTATGTVDMPGQAPLSFSVAPGTQTYVTFPRGAIGGRVRIASDQPVLASQRVQYYQSFNEVASESVSQALTISHVMWFDKASPGMVGDNIHVLNTSTTTANVTVSLPGYNPLRFSVAPGAEAYVTFPQGSIGGPVFITSDQPVIAASRVQYYQTFNEVPAA